MLACIRPPPPIRAAPPILPPAACMPAPARPPWPCCCASTGVAIANESDRAVAPKTPNLVMPFLQIYEGRATALQRNRSDASPSFGATDHRQNDAPNRLAKNIARACTL